MDISTLIPQLGLSAIFAVAVYKLYNDMREDSKQREEKLMTHLEKVADTLEKIDERLSKLEDAKDD
jgi:hypothetical protein